ncbi:MAG: 2-amino-4-hydroxy-6-hydroxymethyldihydropteridine diphosphokinase [Chloroflexota bacterium]
MKYERLITRHSSLIMNRVVVALGSNVNKEENLPAAVRLLAQLCHLVAVSSVYETAAAGRPDQPTFFNAAVLVETELDAAHFKAEVLDQVERQLGRERTADKNAPRTIDADLILFNEEVFDLGTRHVPDPDLLQYLHVAVPVAEVAPDLLHPETGESLAHVAGRLLAEIAPTHDPAALIRRYDDVRLKTP